MDDDVQQFLNKISEEEFQRLGDLIMGNNKMESLQLSCQLVSRHFPHIPELACQQYGSYIHDMLQQSVKHYFANQHSFFGGGQQYTYSINNFFDYGEGEHLNDMYDISDDVVNMTLSINSRYNVLVLDSENNINLHPNILFLGEVRHEDGMLEGLTFDFDGEEGSVAFDFFSIMNPDNANELNLGHRNQQESDDDSEDNGDDSDNDIINDDENTEIDIENDANIIHTLQPDEECAGVGLGNRPISDEDLSDEEEEEDDYGTHERELRENRWNEIEFPWQEHTTPREYYQIIEGHEYEAESNEENVTSRLTREEDTEHDNDFTNDINILEYSLDMQPDEEFRNMTQNISDIENADTEIDDDANTEVDNDSDIENADTEVDNDSDIENADTEVNENYLDFDDDDTDTDFDNDGVDIEYDSEDTDYQPENTPSDDDLDESDNVNNYINFNE